MTQYHISEEMSSGQLSCENMKFHLFNAFDVEVVAILEMLITWCQIQCHIPAHCNLNHLVISVEVKPSIYS